MSDSLTSFGHAQALESMMTFATWQGRFNESDREAMKEALGVIRTAIVQPVGASGGAKARDARCVTDAEYDRAVMTVLCTAMLMWLSGALDSVEVADE